jgi:hypothetical protein
MASFSGRRGYGRISHLRWRIPASLPWIAIAGMGAGTVLGYALRTETFPKSTSGRANGALNFLHIGRAFGMQAGIAFVIEHWPVEAGRRRPMPASSASITVTRQPSRSIVIARTSRRATQVGVWTMTTLVRLRLGFANLCGLWLAKQKLSPSPSSHVWSSTVRLRRPTSTSPASFPECW